ncbi:hypothetical protein ABZP36_001701 [Zizania latifolia]
MDFFKSILADPEPSPASPPAEPEPEPAGSTSTPSADGGGGSGGGGWGFGGLLKTLTSQSENVLEAYRRDLAEFGTGLRRETEAFRDVAARAARDLPSSVHALDGLADIVAQGKDAIAQVAAAAGSSAAPASTHSDGDSEPSSASAQVRYNRFEAQLRALQSDPATFTADPEDAADFAAWRAGFSVEERNGEIEALCYESDVLEGMLDRLVPGTVDSEVFWARYFYRVHKLKQQEDVRAKLVKRVFAAEEDEEDLSWEVDDEDEEEPQRVEAQKEGTKQEPIKQDIEHAAGEKESERVVEEKKAEAVEELHGLEKEQKNAEAPQPEVFGSSMVVVDKEENFSSSMVVVDKEKEETSKSNIEESGDKKPVTEEPHSSTGDDAVKEGAKHESSDSSKDSDFSMVSRQRTTEEEDLEWDEIEDLGEHEEKRGSTHDSNPALKEELRKRLSVADDDEDLSWDIEDDDDKA